MLRGIINDSSDAHNFAHVFRVYDHILSLLSHTLYHFYWDNSLVNRYISISKYSHGSLYSKKWRYNKACHALFVELKK